MKAGRELDAIVAVQVMGWRYTTQAPPDASCPTNPDTGWWISPTGKAQCATCVDDPHPAYSTEIAAAWEVFHHVMRTWYFSQRDAFFDALRDEATLKDGAKPEGLWALQVLKDRFPEAICLAALACVGVKWNN